MEVGEMLRKLRHENGIYQKELAKYLNVSNGTISNYEKGTHFPDLETLQKLAEYFGVSTDYLLGRTDFCDNLDILNNTFSTDYTVSQLMNTVLELPPKDREALSSYVKYLKSCQKSRKS